MIMHSIFKNTPSQQIKQTLYRAKHDNKTKVKQAKKDYFSNKIESSNNKCKTAWSIIRQVNGVDKSKSTNISPQEFNDYFVKSVDEIKSNIGVTQISPLVLLQNKMIRETHICMER